MSEVNMLDSQECHASHSTFCLRVNIQRGGVVSVQPLILKSTYFQSNVITV